MKNFILKTIRLLPKVLIVTTIDIFNIIAKQATKLSLKLSINILQRPEVKEWYKVNGDKKLRIDYPLNESSVVFDVGGFIGEWTSVIFLKYMPNIYIFEPVPDAMKIINDTFKYNNKIKKYNFGLSNKNEKVKISSGSHTASTFKTNTGENCIEIQLKKLSDFVRDESIKHIDLIKINIEGGEYDLLEHIIDSGLINSIQNIQVQFHDFVPHAEERMKKIQESLSKTHRLTYQYKFVWENWYKK